MVERYVSFGERVGAVPLLVLPLDNVPASFRLAVWNFVQPRFSWRGQGNAPDCNATRFLLLMARDKRWDMDRYRGQTSEVCLAVIKQWLLDPDNQWYEIYEFLESFCRWAEFRENDFVARWENRTNHLLFEEQSPYRFVDHKLAPLIAEEEVQEVAQAAEIAGKYQIAADHLKKALTKFAMRPTPDYENAAKEAASAVESALNIANGKQLKVGDAVKTFAATYSVHPALMLSAGNLFGYASDRDGVRHAKTSNTNAVAFAEAKLVIVSASAWVNFIAATAP